MIENSDRLIAFAAQHAAAAAAIAGPPEPATSAPIAYPERVSCGL
jgi:hypothetical protein